jgi:hypothetical protein
MRPLESFELLPHIGATGLRFGMSRADVLAYATERNWFLREDSERGLRYGLQTAGPAVSFAADGGVAFIEFRADRDLELRYCGINVFDIAAKELLASIADHERKLGYTRDPYIEAPTKPLAGSTIFLGEIITLYEAAKQYDYWGKHTRLVFGAVSVGSRAYLAETHTPWEPPKPAPSDARRYRHAKFGLATLVAQKDDTLELLFDDGVTRKLNAKFVERSA